jgi:hypothetical protein
MIAQRRDLEPSGAEKDVDRPVEVASAADPTLQWCAPALPLGDRRLG